MITVLSEPRFYGLKGFLTSIILPETCKRHIDLRRYLPEETKRPLNTTKRFLLSSKGRLP